MTNYIAVGDVHGQHRLLLEAIQTLSNGDTYFILLGDLNDARMKGPAQAMSSSLKCIQIAMQLEKANKGITLQSNHGVYLYRVLLHGADPNEVVKEPHSREGLMHTLREIWRLPLDEQRYIGYWLSNRPYCYKAVINNKTWYASHAMWVPGMDPYSPTHKQVLASVYGKGGDESTSGKRVKFWNDEEYIRTIPPNTYTVSGHYHKVINKEPCYVIDGNCGNGGPLHTLCLNTVTLHTWKEPPY